MVGPNYSNLLISEKWSVGHQTHHKRNWDCYMLAMFIAQ